MTLKKFVTREKIFASSPQLCFNVTFDFSQANLRILLIIDQIY